MHLQKVDGQNNLMMTSAGNLIAINSGRMFSANASSKFMGELYCREAVTGQLLWSRSINLHSGGAANLDYIEPTTAYQIDRIYNRIGCFGNDDVGVYGTVRGDWRVKTVEYNGDVTSWIIDEFGDNIPDNFDMEQFGYGGQGLTFVGIKDDLIFVYFHCAETYPYTAFLQCWNYREEREIDGVIVHGKLEWETSFPVEWTNGESLQIEFGTVATDGHLYLVDSDVNNVQPIGERDGAIGYVINETNGSVINSGAVCSDRYFTQDWQTGEYITVGNYMIKEEIGNGCAKVTTYNTTSRLTSSGWSTEESFWYSYYYNLYPGGTCPDNPDYTYPMARVVGYSVSHGFYYASGVEVAGFNESSGHPWGLPDSWDWAVVMWDSNRNLIFANEYDAIQDYSWGLKLWSQFIYYWEQAYPGNMWNYHIGSLSARWSLDLFGYVGSYQSFITT